LHREEIKTQVALINPLMHVEGYAAADTKEAVERARSLIEQAEERGEPLEDPLLLLSVLYGLYMTNLLAFNGSVCRDLSAYTLMLAQKQSETFPLLIAHRLEAGTLVFTGDIAKSQIHFDRGLTLL
jgi:hypothetical protein